jgi:Putative zinc-finger
MMTCKEVAEHASEYLDREMPPLRRWSLRLHQLLCRDCREFVGGLRSLVSRSPVLRSSGEEDKYGALARKWTPDEHNGPVGPELGRDEDA